MAAPTPIGAALNLLLLADQTDDPVIKAYRLLQDSFFLTPLARQEAVDYGPLVEICWRTEDALAISRICSATLVELGFRLTEHPRLRAERGDAYFEAAFAAFTRLIRLTKPGEPGQPSPARMARSGQQDFAARASYGQGVLLGIFRAVNAFDQAGDAGPLLKLLADSFGELLCYQWHFCASVDYATIDDQLYKALENTVKAFLHPGARIDKKHRRAYALALLQEARFFYGARPRLTLTSIATQTVDIICRELDRELDTYEQVVLLTEGYAAAAPHLLPDVSATPPQPV